MARPETDPYSGSAGAQSVEIWAVNITSKKHYVLVPETSYSNENNTLKGITVLGKNRWCSTVCIRATR